MAFVDVAGWDDYGVAGDEASAAGVPWGAVGRALAKVGAWAAGAFGFGLAAGETFESAGVMVLLGLLVLLVTTIVVVWALGRVK